MSIKQFESILDEISPHMLVVEFAFHLRYNNYDKVAGYLSDIIEEFPLIAGMQIGRTIIPELLLRSIINGI